MPLTTQIKTRKQQRKEARKKRKHRGGHHDPDDAATTTRRLDNDEEEHLTDTVNGHDGEATDPSRPTKVPRTASSSSTKSSRESKSNRNGDINAGDRYKHLDPSLAEAMKRDDDEIAELEKKLGFGNGSQKKKSSKDKLNKEYSKLEGYGDDFGDFLDDLDDMVLRLTDDRKGGSKDGKPQGATKSTERENIDGGAPYSNINPSTAEALRQDDEVIEDLEMKLGISKRKDKDKLYKEYSKLEGYGDDFGDFLDDLDDMMVRLRKPMNKDTNWSRRGDEVGDDDGHRDTTDDDNETTGEAESDYESGNSDSEELVPMKGAYEEMDEDDSVLEEIERIEAEDEQSNKYQPNEFQDGNESGEEEEDEGDEDQEIEDDRRSDGSIESDADNADHDSQESESDHDVGDTYRPSVGEDIYGNTLATENTGDTKPSKYVPPHMRKKLLEDDEGDQERRRVILRSLNSSLNRLSEDTLISVAQQVASLYSGNPTQMVHEMIWKNAKDACVSPSMLMTGLIPVYIGCIVGVHIQTGDTVQLGEAILEFMVVDLLGRLAESRKSVADTGEGIYTAQDETQNKQICNMMLMLGYLYNYNIVHCSFMYDIVRELVDNLSEVDIECLLILLSHCGRSLRSDDPSALKEIVLLIQKKKVEKSKMASSSRAEYMIAAIMDLKNNRRKKQDTVHAEIVSKFRKSLGRIKTAAAKSGASKSGSEASLRISLQDILNAEQKGRWWKVGASWAGNQHRFSEDSMEEHKSREIDEEASRNGIENNDENEELLQLASKLRMNTDRKRSIFCIIMGGNDCEDTFEKLSRTSMLQNRSERDTVRVLLECCGSEKSYNKFYGYLAARICEYQPQSKFSLQLAYWDAFKQFDSMGVRKAANLAKFLFHLVVTHRTLKLLPIIKTIDVSDEDTDETAMIFLTIVLSSVLDHFDDPLQAKSLFARHISRSKDGEKQDEQDEAIRAGLLIFFMETLKSSPKNTKGSRFRKNFKAVIKELDADGFESMF